MLKAFAALDEAKQSELKDDLHALIARMNKAGDGTMVVPHRYLEVVITKRSVVLRNPRKRASLCNANLFSGGGSGEIVPFLSAAPIVKCPV